MSADFKDRWCPGGASCRWPFTRSALFHPVPLRILLQRHPQTGAHLHPTGWDFFPLFYAFLFYCHATVCWSLLSYDAVPVVFFHFSVVAHVNFDAVFSQRYFLPSQKADAQNAEMEMVSWLLLSFCSYFFKLYLYLLQNQKTIPPSQQPIASASVLPTSLCPICILAVGRSCRKSSTATCHS